MFFHHIESTPLFQCRVKWEANTLVMWDNIGTQHHACWDYFPQARYGERVSAVGVDLHAAA
jgi:taurine dioxygenase